MPSSIIGVIKDSSQWDTWLFHLSSANYLLNSLPEWESLGKKVFSNVVTVIDLTQADGCSVQLHFSSSSFQIYIDQFSGLCDELHPITSYGIYLFL